MTLIEAFEAIQDPRVDRTRRHDLLDIVIATICAVASGAEGWEAIAKFTELKLDWLRRFIRLRNGVPSADTFRRVISAIDSKNFSEAFFSWTAEVFTRTDGEVISIDGKTVRNKRDLNPIHLVSAWTNSNGGICLGQVASDEKSNEITAIPELLNLLDVKGCLITIDAMGCQRDIAASIVNDHDADYILSLKENHPTLYAAVEKKFQPCQGLSVDGFRRNISDNVGHGRKELRVAYITNEIQELPLELWPTVAAVGMVISTRTINGKSSTERRYYLLSTVISARAFSWSVREHWGIENRLHWILDVSIGEDGNRINRHNGAEAMGTIRKVLLAALKTMPGKESIAMKRRMMGWDPAYLESVLKQRN